MRTEQSSMLAMALRDLGFHRFDFSSRTDVYRRKGRHIDGTRYDYSEYGNAFAHPKGRDYRVVAQAMAGAAADLAASGYVTYVFCNPDGEVVNAFVSTEYCPSPEARIKVTTFERAI